MKMSNYLLIVCVCGLLLAGCAGAPAFEPVQIPIPPRPMISLKYQELLIKAGPDTAKEGLKHEVEWLGWADKMENRVAPEGPKK